MIIVRLDDVDSTNSWVSSHWEEINKPAMVYALSQTAGRGQRGNSWEAEPGKNLTATAALELMDVEPKNQFLISEAIALAVVDTLVAYDISARVKWPNDIYVGECKICGILIENSILGHSITRTLAGIGLNVNQKEFHSDAPNPVSMTGITGKTYDIAEVTEKLAEMIEKRLAQRIEREKLSEEYHRNLWRHDGEFYPFSDKKENLSYRGKIRKVSYDGVLEIENFAGEIKTYLFKEIEFLLSEK